MNRRAILKGGLVFAVATPAAAVAPLMSNTLADLIAHHDEVWERCKHVQDLVDEISCSDESPAYPVVTNNELGYSDLGGRMVMFSDADIDRYFDRRVVVVERHIAINCNPARNREAIVKIEKDRPEAKRLLASKSVPYQRWRTEKEIPGLEEESERLSSLEFALHKRIMSWDVASLDEVRAIARYLERVHDGKVPNEDLLEFLKVVA